MPGTTEAITFTDSYKHMECLGGMMLQSFLMVTLFTRATPGTPASYYYYCLSVCLWTTLLTKLRTDWDEILWRGPG